MISIYRHFLWPVLVLSLGLLSCSDDTEPAADAKVKTDSGMDGKTADGKPADSKPGEGKTSDAKPDTTTAAKELVILHTNDLHDALLGWNPNADYTPATTGDDSTLGGFARLATLIATEKSTAQKAGLPVLVLDGGDFSMGSLFSWLNITKAPMISLMQQVGYDAITLGNHEFDWGPKALAAMLSAASASSIKVPVIASNLTFSSTSTEDDTLAALQTSGVIKSKLVKTLSNGLKVGFFGLLGKTAAGLAPLATPVTFSDAATAATAMVKELRTTDKVDLVIALSHSGTGASGTVGDDADLANAVTGIDVIISGHTHVALAKPETVNKTLIVQTGSYGKSMGKLHLSFAGGKASVKKYELVPLDDTTKGDASITTLIDGYISTLDTLLTQVGLSFKKVLAETSFDLTFPSFQETGLGNLITDAYRLTTAALDTTDPPVVAIEANGVIRDPIMKGKTGQIWFADMLRAIPLGVGPDQKPGYPLVTFYLTPKDLKSGMEVLEVAKSLVFNDDYWLQVSGMTVELSKTASVFSTVQKITLGTTALDLTDDKTCYRVVTNLYTATMIGSVSKATGGMIKVEPKLKDCKTVITSLKDQIFKLSNGAELKQWQALAMYLSKLPDADSDTIPDLPTKYSKAENRLVFK